MSDLFDVLLSPDSVCSLTNLWSLDRTPVRNFLSLQIQTDFIWLLR